MIPWDKTDCSRLRLIGASVVAGVLIGVGAHLLKTLIRAVSLLCTNSFHAEGGNLSLLWVPLAGIIITGILVRYVFRHPLEHETEQIRDTIAGGRPHMPAKLTVAPLLASSVTLGFGGSAGSEGPIAYAGAAIGENIGSLFRLTPQQRMTLLACGAGAGIAAIFKAPFGGALFTIEVLAMALTTETVLQLVLMCLASSLTCFALSGFAPDMLFVHPLPFHAADLIPTLLLGLWCGIYSAYYIKTGTLTRNVLERLANPWVRNAVSGLMLSAALFLFPALYGEGYSLMAKVVNGDPSATLAGLALTPGSHPILWALAGILAVKSIACYATNSGGGVAGDFAPTLYAGCMAGALFALGSAAIGGPQLAVGNYALAGMAGVMAGAIRAPFMAIFLTVEMSFTSSLIFPVAICAAVSYFVSLTIVKPSRTGELIHR